jgi:hypothetical protein
LKLYAETSAVLTWVLNQDQGREIGHYVSAAEVVVASRLTIMEARRNLTRAALPEAVTAGMKGQLVTAQSGWQLISVDSVFDRVGMLFPAEPVRTLDAIHLATAVMLRELYPDLIVLSLDHRVRSNARALGFPVLPEMVTRTTADAPV